MTDKCTFLETWFRRVWTEQDTKAIEELFNPSGFAEGLGNQTLIGPDQFKQFHAALSQQITDIHFTIDKCMEEDPWVSMICTLDAKARKTGQPVRITGTAFVRIENGQIVEAYNHFDFISLWSQLELLPSDGFERCLRGERMAVMPDE